MVLNMYANMVQQCMFIQVSIRIDHSSHLALQLYSSHISISIKWPFSKTIRPTQSYFSHRVAICPAQLAYHTYFNINQMAISETICLAQSHFSYRQLYSQLSLPISQSHILTFLTSCYIHIFQSFSQNIKMHMYNYIITIQHPILFLIISISHSES